MAVVDVRKMGDDAEAQRLAAAVFVEGYYKDLSTLCKDKNRLINAFAGGFNADVCYIAAVDGEVVGLAACSNNKGRALQLDLKRMRRGIGFFKGSLAYAFMHKEFHAPLTGYADNAAYIECVATAPQARGKGVATSIMQFILNKLPYNEYILHVADTNPTAQSIYNKLGFTEFDRKKESLAKIKGVNYQIYMKINTP